jgi:hypothetical protein
MGKNNLVEFSGREAGIRAGTRQLICQAVEAELQEEMGPETRTVP